MLIVYFFINDYVESFQLVNDTGSFNQLIIISSRFLCLTEKKSLKQQITHSVYLVSIYAIILVQRLILICKQCEATNETLLTEVDKCHNLLSTVCALMITVVDGVWKIYN